MWAGPDSAPQSSLFLLVSTGSGPVIRAGPEPAQTRKEKQVFYLGGEGWGGWGLFCPSHPPACRAIFVLHVGGDEAKDESKVGEERKVTWRGGGGALLVWLRT